MLHGSHHKYMKGMPYKSKKSGMKGMDYSSEADYHSKAGKAAYKKKK